MQYPLGWLLALAIGAFVLSLKERQRLAAFIRGAISSYLILWILRGSAVFCRCCRSFTLCAFCSNRVTVIAERISFPYNCTESSSIYRDMATEA